MDLEYLLEQLKIGQESVYFQNGKIKKIVYYKNDHTLSLFLELEKPLPFRVWRIFRDSLMRTLK